MIHDSPTVTFEWRNEWDIPELMLDGPPVDLAAPLVPWGSVSRKTKLQGKTVCFYVDDYRFRPIAEDPSRLISVNPMCACEPNCSLFSDTPKAWAIWATYCKHRAARTWQDAGIGVLVDLCVPPEMQAINLMGVPHGYRWYCTRGFAARSAEVTLECGVAAEHGGSGARVLVYGGGRTIRDLCTELPNAVWCPQYADRRRKIEGFRGKEVEVTDVEG